MSTLVGFRMGRDGADFEPYIPRVSQLSTYFSQHMSFTRLWLLPRAIVFRHLFIFHSAFSAHVVTIPMC